MHENPPFSGKNSIFFSGEVAQSPLQTPPQWGGEHPLPKPNPLGALIVGPPPIIKLWMRHCRGACLLSF